MPKFGTIVVNGYSAISGFAAVIVAKSVDFPAFGKPTKPTSAKTFNSKIAQDSIPGSPGCAKRGA